MTLASATSPFLCAAQAPTRVDLVGGTLDIWPLAPILQEKHGLWNSRVATVNVAIDLYARVECELYPEVHHRDGHGVSWTFEDTDSHASESGRSLDGGDRDVCHFPLHRTALRHYVRRFQDHGVGRVILRSATQTPRGSGLGGSSSLITAILASFERFVDTSAGSTPRPSSKVVFPALDLKKLCAMGQNLEAGVLGNLAGNQDHFAAAYGGVQEVVFAPEGTFSNRIPCDGKGLLSHIVLAHSGQQHFSAFNNWQMLQKVLSGDKDILSKFAFMAELAKKAPALLSAGDWPGMGRLMNDEWVIRRSLAPDISTPVLDLLHEKAVRAGAVGGKVCGAGGGGVLVMVVDSPAARAAVEKALTAAGGQIISAGYSDSGVDVQVRQPLGG